MTNSKYQITQHLKSLLEIGNWRFVRQLTDGNSHKGFTLIELLIVIAIIGILSTVLMVNFIGIRERARDARRKSDLFQMQQAVELAKADNASGLYPIDIGDCNDSFTSDTGATYMAKLPCDPISSGIYVYHYAPISGGSGYELWACLENQNDGDKNSGSFSITTDLIKCGNTYKTFKVTNQ